MLPDYEYLKREMENKRKEIGWSRKRLASESGVPEAVISDLEEGVGEPGYKDLRRIDKALEKELSEERK